MIIKVTQDHISKGKRYNGYACPIALAMIKAGLLSPVISPTDVSFDYYQNKMDLKSVRMLRKTPQVVSEFIRAFDKGMFVKPFEFELTI